MKRLTFLYRCCNSPSEDQAEIDALTEAGFVHLRSRTSIESNDLVLPRYCCVPFFDELEKDVKEVGAELINSHQQHIYVADLKNYVADLKETTPETWDRLEDIPDQGPFFLKGATNSLKGRFLTHCYAEDKQQAGQVYWRLLEDSLIGQQEIYIRRFVKLKTYMEGIGGIPITNEFRFFVYRGQVLSGGYYWASHVDDLPSIPSPDQVPREFLDKVIKRIGNNINYYALDVAETEQGDWMVVELNDGSMSGLSLNAPKTLYQNLYAAMENNNG